MMHEKLQAFRSKYTIPLLWLKRNNEEEGQDAMNPRPTLSHSHFKPETKWQ